MFQRYTQTARRVIFSARYMAGRAGSPNIETEHILLGLLREDKGLARRFLGSPWAVQEVWEAVEQLKPVQENVPVLKEIPLTNESKHILTFAFEEADIFRGAGRVFGFTEDSKGTNLPSLARQPETAVGSNYFERRLEGGCSSVRFVRLHGLDRSGGTAYQRHMGNQLGRPHRRFGSHSTLSARRMDSRSRVEIRLPPDGSRSGLNDQLFIPQRILGLRRQSDYIQMH